MEGLVRGIVVRRAGDAIEKVSTAAMSLELLGSGDGTEVMIQRIEKGRRFSLRPEEGWKAMEFFYLLQGGVVWDNGERRVVLGPGDSLAGNPVQEPCIVEAVSDVVGLYVCSQPVFHLVSHEMLRFHELAVSVEMKDGYTADHCARIKEWSVEVGRRLQLSPAFLHVLALPAG